MARVILIGTKAGLFCRAKLVGMFVMALVAAAGLLAGTAIAQTGKCALCVSANGICSSQSGCITFSDQYPCGSTPMLSAFVQNVVRSICTSDCTYDQDCNLTGNQAVATTFYYYPVPNCPDPPSCTITCSVATCSGSTPHYLCMKNNCP